MSHETATTVMATPIGPVTVTVSRKGLLGVAFGDITTGDTTQDTVPPAVADTRTEIIGQLREYFAGSRERFEVTLDWSRVSGWPATVLRVLDETVGYGETIGYQQLAARAGRPNAARAVGRVMANNPLPIVVPCHRVIAADGAIGGFAGSGGALVELKRRLLELEGSAAPTLF
ncbi:methylated-DNA--[protein]-cysteine S-methyltransferase [Stackebrandtia soli]|uniref:methylated-DNA--[protein]-cysteine S-methyltransferase n=1 Tax=Stackebrandtia soli TaxID=1892856 RepID=UPI0039EA7133